MARGRKPKTQSRGLGDTIAKVTEAVGIDKVVKAITDGCGCEDRRASLNKMFAYRLKVVNCPTEEDTSWYKDFANTRTLTLSNEQRKKICHLYSHTFNVPYFEPCINCSPKPYLEMINRLDKVFGI